MLKNANTAAIMDVTIANWTEQVALVPSALVRAVKELSGITCATKELGAKRTGKDGRANNVRVLLQVPKGVDNHESFIIGSDVGQALIDPRFKAKVDAIISELALSPSAILDINVALNQGLVVTAPGLIVEDADAGTVPMNLTAYRSTAFHDIYQIKPSTDVAIDGVASLNWTQTALKSVDGAEELHSMSNYFYNNNVDFPALDRNAMIGDWDFRGDTIMSDLAGTPTLTTFSHIITSAPRNLKLDKDAVNVFDTPIASLGTLGVLEDSIRLNRGSRGDVFSNSMRVGRFSDVYSSYREDAVAYKEIQSATRALKITNSLGAVIPAGAVLGYMQVEIAGIAEVL